MLYKNEYGPLNKEELNIDNIKKIRDKNEFYCINSLKENEMKKILLKEEVFKDFCFFLKTVCKNYDNFEKSNLEEKWGIILKNNNIDELRQNYEKLKLDKKEEIQNNLIKIKQIINYSDNSNSFFTEIFEKEPDYSWAALIKYSCILAKEKVNWSIINKFRKKEKAIEKFKLVKNKINIFIEDLSSQSTLNILTFSFFIKNKDKIKNKGFKTEIEIQNEKRKTFLEIIKSLIDDNIETIEKFINENNSENTLETDKMLSIEDIINKSNEIDIKFEKDIKIYMNEFGFNYFEILIIKKTKRYIGNIIVITLGVLEFCAGTILLQYSLNPKIFKLARFLIREGIKDIIKGVKSTIEGQEIDLKNFGIEKSINITICNRFSYRNRNKAN